MNKDAVFDPQNKTSKAIAMWEFQNKYYTLQYKSIGTLNFS